MGKKIHITNLRIKDLLNQGYIETDVDDFQYVKIINKHSFIVAYANINRKFAIDFKTNYKQYDLDTNKGKELAWADYFSGAYGHFSINEFYSDNEDFAPQLLAELISELEIWVA